jgi:DNA-binding GntR family transcriptional regulator
MADDPRLYVRVAKAFRERILDGDLKPGDAVPNIRTTRQETGYSRQTIGKAFRILEADGLIKRIPGRGYYVE